MAKQDYPDFDGWTVTVNRRGGLQAEKPYPGEKNDHLFVFGYAENMDRLYLTLKQDAYAEEVRVTQPGFDERGDPLPESAEYRAAKERFAQAQKALIADKVKAALANGNYGDDPEAARVTAIQRLTEAGFSLAEMADVVGE